MDRGTAYAEVSRLFGVSLATIGRYARRRRETGEVAPRPSPGRTPSICKSAEECRVLWEQLEADPEDLPVALRDMLRSCGSEIS